MDKICLQKNQIIFCKIEDHNIFVMGYFQLRNQKNLITNLSISKMKAAKKIIF